MRARRLQAQLRLTFQAFGRTALRPHILAVVAALGACTPVELDPPQLDLLTDPGPPVDPLARNPDAPVIVRNGKGEVLAEMHPGKSGDASANPPLSAFDGTLGGRDQAQRRQHRAADGDLSRRAAGQAAARPRHGPLCRRGGAAALRRPAGHWRVQRPQPRPRQHEPVPTRGRRRHQGLGDPAGQQLLRNLRPDRRRVPAQPRRADVEGDAGLSRPPRRVSGIDVDVLAGRRARQWRPVRHLHARQRRRHRPGPARRHLLERIPARTISASTCASSTASTAGCM